MLDSEVYYQAKVFTIQYLITYMVLHFHPIRNMSMGGYSHQQHTEGCSPTLFYFGGRINMEERLQRELNTLTHYAYEQLPSPTSYQCFYVHAYAIRIPTDFYCAITFLQKTVTERFAPHLFFSQHTSH